MFDKLKRVLGVNDEEDDYYEEDDMEFVNRNSRSAGQEDD